MLHTLLNRFYLHHDLETSLYTRDLLTSFCFFPIESLVVRDDLTSTIANFAGDEMMGDNWLEKIAAAKATLRVDEEPSEIADDEWVSFSYFSEAS